MLPDNQWHSAVCVKKSDGNFIIFETLEEAEQKCSDAESYQNVKYNWNKGQPIVDFGGFQMNIVDIGLKPKTV